MIMICRAHLDVAVGGGAGAAADTGVADRLSHHHYHHHTWSSNMSEYTMHACAAHWSGMPTRQSTADGA